MLVNKLTDCDAEATETQVWLDFALDCGYMSQTDHDRLTRDYEEVGKMLFGMMANPKASRLRNRQRLTVRCALPGRTKDTTYVE